MIFRNYANLEKVMADGGRVGLFMGGQALTGQALHIYNSMNAYNALVIKKFNALSTKRFIW